MGKLSDSSKLTKAEVLAIKGMLDGGMTPVGIAKILDREVELVKHVAKKYQPKPTEDVDTEENRVVENHIDKNVRRHKKGTGVVVLTQGGSEAGDVTLVKSKTPKQRPDVFKIHNDE